MHLRRWFLTLGLLGLLGFVTVLPAAAASTTIVWQANLTIPLINKTALGTLTTIVDNATGQGTWSFQGTIDGQFAQSSGKGTFSGGGSTATVTMTSVDTWQMPGLPQPALPATATIRSAGNIAYVSFGAAIGVPVAVSQPLTFPLQGGTYTLTTPGSGGQAVPNLPNTGGEPAMVPRRPLDMIVAITALSLVAAGGAALTLALDRRRQRPDVTA